MPDPGDALRGRAEPITITEPHHVNGASLTPPWPDGARTAIFGLGCFWGAEKDFWQTDGVISTAVGYAGGYTPNPTYEETCSGQTGHAEVVLVAYDPERISYEQLLKVFWEHHDPTQGMRQGNDQGTQYRSLIMVGSDDERATAQASRDAYQAQLTAAGYGEITTEIVGCRASSTTPSPTTSNTSARIRRATAPTTAPAWPARSAWGSMRSERTAEDLE